MLEKEKKGYGWGEEVSAAGKESIVGTADDKWAFSTLGHFSDYLGVRNNGPLEHWHGVQTVASLQIWQTCRNVSIL